jgi:ferric-dicitrate binding protein FerR (iron transport regulator)
VSGRRPRGRALAGVGLCALMVCLLLWASIVVLPRAEAARRARDDSAFALAHRTSVQLNGLTLLAGAALLLLETLRRPAPRDR